MQLLLLLAIAKTECVVANGLREVSVVDDVARVVGFLNEREVAKIYLNAGATVPTVNV